MYGVVECSRELFKQDNLKASDFLIDIGAASKKDAEAYVSLGDTVVLDAGVRELANGRLAARAFDDRWCFVIWRY